MPNRKQKPKEATKVGGALTTAALAENVSKKLGDEEITPEKVRQVADAFFALVRREIFDNGSFRLQQLGTFERMRVEASERRNPRTGETVITPEHYKVKFVPVAGLARRVNKPYENLKPQVIEEAAETQKSETQTRSAEAQSHETPKAETRLQKSERRVQAIDETESADETPLDETNDADENFDDALPSLEVPDFAFDKDDENDVDEKIVKDAAQSMREINNDGGFSERKIINNEIADDDKIVNQEFNNVDSGKINNGNDADGGVAGGDVASGTETVSQQTIQNAVIEKLIVRRPIVQSKKLPSDDERRGVGDNEKEEADEFQKFINRCWFFAGAAVILTILVLGAFVYVFLQRTPNGEIVAATQTRPVATAQESVGVLPQTQTASAENASPQGRSDTRQSGGGVATVAFSESDATIRNVRIAPEGNIYESLAERNYGAGNLWPYIFSANMLRFPDPDRPGPATSLSIPPQPDKFIDRRDIELSVIDVYDSYQSLIAQGPRSDAADIRRQHAVTVLVCGESLYAGFLDKYAVRLQPNDVAAARAIVAEAAR